MHIENPAWAVQVRDVVGRLYQTDPARIGIEIQDNVVLINFQESMLATQEVNNAIRVAVKALLPEKYKGYTVSIV